MHKLSAAFLDMARQHLTDPDWPVVQQTSQRLQNEGYTAAQALQLIALCVGTEMMAVIEEDRPFDRAVYYSHLAQLPALPETR